MNLDEAKRRIADLADELKQALADNAHLRGELAVVRMPLSGVWLWQGQGNDVASLSCPVVMSAETLREIVVERAEARVAVKRAYSALQGRLGDGAADVNAMAETVVFACEEYVAAEDQLPENFDGDGYLFSKAVRACAEAYIEAREKE